MRLTPDTNILVRAAVRDDPIQTPIAISRIRSASVVALSIPVLCEFVWVLTKSYKRSQAQAAVSVRALLAAKNVIADKPAIEAGLAFMAAGADFSDGVIAFEGRVLGGDSFTSFDRDAMRAAASLGFDVLEP